MIQTQQEAERQKIEAFFDGIGLCEAGRKEAERLLREEPTLLTLPLEQLLFDPKQYEKGLENARAAVGEDGHGMKLFVYLCRCALQTYRNYAEKGISPAVYRDTMRFLSRFLADDLKKSGALAFRWGWWFPRQLAMLEFRLGALEYEMTESGQEDGDGGENISGNGRARKSGKIFIHIPSDADLSENSVTRSLCAARRFFAEHYPAYAAAEMACESWMLVPALRELLPASSHVAQFGRRFEVQKVDEESKAFLEWIFPDPALPYAQLPENTTLQRNVKKYLLEGGKLGWAYGILRR